MFNTFAGNKLFKSGKFMMTSAAVAVAMVATMGFSALNADSVSADTVASTHASWTANSASQVSSTLKTQNVSSYDQVGNYVPAWGDTLDTIAAHFNVTADKIAGDFNISDKNFIVAGTAIKNQSQFNGLTQVAQSAVLSQVAPTTSASAQSSSAVVSSPTQAAPTQAAPTQAAPTQAAPSVSDAHSKGSVAQGSTPTQASASATTDSAAKPSTAIPSNNSGSSNKGGADWNGQVNGHDASFSGSDKDGYNVDVDGSGSNVPVSGGASSIIKDQGSNPAPVTQPKSDVPATQPKIDVPATQPKIDVPATQPKTDANTGNSDWKGQVNGHKAGMSGNDNDGYNVNVDGQGSSVPTGSAVTELPDKDSSSNSQSDTNIGGASSVISGQDATPAPATPAPATPAPTTPATPTPTTPATPGQFNGHDAGISGSDKDGYNANVDGQGSSVPTGSATIVGDDGSILGHVTNNNGDITAAGNGGYTIFEIN